MVDYSKQSTATAEAQQTEPEEVLRADPDRASHRPVTNIMVRGIKADGSKGNIDLAHLDKRSLKQWLAKDASVTARAVLVMLRHQLEEGDY